MEASFLVRNARREDLPRVIEINRRCLPENYPVAFFEEHLERWGKAFFVAECDENVVGYVMCRVEWGWSNFKPAFTRKGHVISLAVEPEYRGMGIGTALMRSALRVLREDYGAEEVYLEVRVSNKPAISLYEKLGFVKVKVIPHYYLDGEDAYLMAMRL